MSRTRDCARYSKARQRHLAGLGKEYIPARASAWVVAWKKAATSRHARKSPSTKLPAMFVLCESLPRSNAGPLSTPTACAIRSSAQISWGWEERCSNRLNSKMAVSNPHFAQYRVPRFRDVPQIEVVLLDRKDLPPAGAGETPIVGIAPAIGNAIFDATGIRLRSLPMVPRGLPAIATPTRASS